MWFSITKKQSRIILFGLSLSWMIYFCSIYKYNNDSILLCFQLAQIIDMIEEYAAQPRRDAGKSNCEDELLISL